MHVLAEFGCVKAPVSLSIVPIATNVILEYITGGLCVEGLPIAERIHLVPYTLGPIFVISSNGCNLMVDVPRVGGLTNAAY